jgi:plastocyanin
MKHRRMLVSILVLTMASGASATAQDSPGGRRVDLVIWNSKYCRQVPCMDVGYTRGLDGPIAGTDNSRAMVEVSPGDTVTWTYRDVDGCDPFTQPFIDCRGHEVTFERGQDVAGTIGYMPARSGPLSVSVVVPSGTQRGSLLRYYCNVRSGTLDGSDYPAGTGVLSAHFLYGMTGILKVV